MDNVIVDIICINMSVLISEDEVLIKVLKWVAMLIACRTIGVLAVVVLDLSAPAFSVKI